MWGGKIEENEIRDTTRERALRILVKEQDQHNASHILLIRLSAGLHLSFDDFRLSTKPLEASHVELLVPAPWRGEGVVPFAERSVS